jgi:cytochrome c oxidase subunit IV
MSTGRVWRCWAALMALLALTTGLAFVPLAAANLFISLGIAVVKALLVLIIFMELKGGSSLIRAAAAAGFFWLAIMIALTTADYTHRTDVRVPLDKVD